MENFEEAIEQYLSLNDGNRPIPHSDRKHKLIGYDTNGDVFEDTYSRFYEFDTHDLKNK